MANGWTPERRARQAQMIKTWQPWKHSTGPKSTEGKARVANNAYTGGEWLIQKKLARALRDNHRVLIDLIADN